MGVIKTADKKPEIYTKPDGRRGVRMVPVDKQIVKTETAMNMRNAKLINKIKKSGVAKQGSMKDEDQVYDKKAVAKKGYDEVDELSMSLKDLTKSGVNKKGYGDKDKLKRDLAALKKKLATESYDMKEMCCKNCGDTFGNPTEGNCMYDAYDKNGKNWVTKKEYLAAQKKNEEVELDENYRQLATKGMGTEYHPKHKFGDTTKVGRGVDYYHPKTGAKGDGKIVKTTDTHYHVKDTKSGQVHKFAYLDKEKAKKLMGESVELEEGPFKGIGKQNKEEVEVNEVLDTPEKYREFKKKAKAQADKARNSATAKIVRGNDDISKEKEILRRRKHTSDRIDRVANRQFRKSIGLGYSAKVEEKYRPATPEEIRKDKERERKAQRAAGNKRASMTTKSINKNLYGKMMGGLKTEEYVNEMGPRHTSKPMKSRFGGAVDSKRFDAYKKFVKQNNVDEPTVRMVIDNPNDAESKRMMKNKNIAKAVDLRKAAMKESIQEKLSVSQGMGAWVDDFKKSDAPQFKGKSDTERRDMAIAAYLSAKRGDK